jgi:hypothetical protein
LRLFFLLLRERHGGRLLLADEFLEHLLSLLLLHLELHQLLFLLLALLALGILFVHQRQVLGHLINVEYFLLFLLVRLLSLYYQLLVSRDQWGIDLTRVLRLGYVTFFHHLLLLGELGVLGDFSFYQPHLCGLGQLLFIIDEFKVA